MQRESEQEKRISWDDIGQVLETEMSSVEDICADLARTDKGNPSQTINNCVMVLQRDPVLKNAIRKNELSGKIDIVGNLGWYRNSSNLTDTDVYQIHWYMERNYGLKNDRNINKAIQEQAETRFDLLVEQMAEQEGVTERLKSEQQLLWVQKMNGIRECAEELVRQEIIFVL